MMRIFLFLALFFGFLHAQKTTLLYDVYYTWLGKIGEVNATFETSGKNYTITVEGKTVYAGYVLSGGWQERHITHGIREGERLKPLTYNRTVTTHTKEIQTNFTFNHKTRQLKRHLTQKEQDIDLLNRNESETKWKTKTKTTYEPYFPSHELSSLMFNLKFLLQHHPKDAPLNLTILGADKKTGAMVIEYPKGKELENARDLLDSNSNNMITMNIDKKALTSNAGMLYLLMDDDYLPHTGAVKDVFLFGDIQVIRRQ